MPDLDTRYLDIANQALSYCGLTGVDNINKDTQECEQIRIYMDAALKDAMYDRDWGFNKDTETMTAVPGDPLAYNLDAGYVNYGITTIKRILPPIRSADGNGYIYEKWVVDNEGNLWVYMGPKNIRVSYLTVVKSIPSWVLQDNRDFIRYAALRLAALISGGITNNPQSPAMVWATNIGDVEKMAAAKKPKPTNYILRDPT